MFSDMHVLQGNTGGTTQWYVCIARQHRRYPTVVCMYCKATPAVPHSGMYVLQGNTGSTPQWYACIARQHRLYPTVVCMYCKATPAVSCSGMYVLQGNTGCTPQWFVCIVRQHRQYPTVVCMYCKATPAVSCNSVSVSVSAQDGIVALGKAHTRSAPSLSSLPKAALETVPIFVWLNTDRSRPWRVECRLLPFSTPLSFRRSVL